MPCDYSKYPPNWKKEIRPRILKRARNRCEHCKVKNNAIIRRLKKSPLDYFYWNDKRQDMMEGSFTGLIIDNALLKPIKIILTVAHLDHDPKNWNVKDDRLAALCQRCHFKTHRIKKETA